MKKVAVIGLGYVGLPLAVEIGKFRNVTGYDINHSRISQLNKKVDLTNECSVDLLKKAKNLSYSNRLSDIKDAEIYIVTVPTPVDKYKKPDLQPLLSATKAVASILKKGDIVIFESTVFPGATEEICVPVLEKESGLIFNTDFFCGYSPERINPGDKVNTITKIKKITSGSTLKVAVEIDKFYSSFIEAGTYLAPSIKVAEAAKVIENSQRDLNIAFVNELSVIFDKLEIDTLEVLEAAGSKWNFLPFRPGMVGGHCIGVDPYYLMHKAEEVGYSPQVILAGRNINDNMAVFAAQSIVKRLLKLGLNVSECKIGVMGITFKENCPDVRNSKIVDLINELDSWGALVSVCDPWADPNEVQNVYNISLVKQESMGTVDALIVAVGHNVYRSMQIKELRKICPGENAVLGDLKSIYDKQKLIDSGFEVFRL